MDVRYISGRKYFVRPCPFCGKTDKLSLPSEETFEDLRAQYGRAAITISCSRCKIDMYEYDDGTGIFVEKVNALIKKWGKRNG